MTPRASFVIPTYNGQAWIAETIRSCQEQSIKQIEIVVVNDGSQDHTQEIVESLAKEDKRIVPVNLEGNVGSGEARNIGNEKASAEIILMLDGDDKAARNRVKDTLACFTLKNPDLVYGGYIAIDSIGNIGNRYAPEAYNKERNRKYKTFFICHSTLAYRKGLTRNIRYSGGDYQRLGMEDWRFYLDAEQKGYKFAWVKSVLVYKRFHEGTFTSHRDEQAIHELKERDLATV